MGSRPSLPIPIGAGAMIGLASKHVTVVGSEFSVSDDYDMGSLLSSTSITSQSSITLGTSSSLSSVALHVSAGGNILQKTSTDHQHLHNTILPSTVQYTVQLYRTRENYCKTGSVQLYIIVQNRIKML